MDSHTQKNSTTPLSLKKASLLLLHKYYAEKAKKETAVEAAKVRESKLSLALRLRRAKRRLLLDNVDPDGGSSSSLSYSECNPVATGDDTFSRRRDEDLASPQSYVPKNSLRLNGASISLED